jgi:hypothetical protein
VAGKREAGDQYRLDPHRASDGSGSGLATHSRHRLETNKPNQAAEQQTCDNQMFTRHPTVLDLGESTKEASVETYGGNGLGWVDAPQD